MVSKGVAGWGRTLDGEELSLDAVKITVQRREDKARIMMTCKEC